MRHIAVSFLMIAAGCGTSLVDPCARQTGACLAIQVDASPAVSRLSTAELHVTGDTIDLDQTVALQGGATSAALPIAVAVVLGDLPTTTNVHVDLLGALSGTIVGETAVDATISPGEHKTVHVSLGAVTDDLGGSADMASTDLANYVPLTVQLSGSGSGAVTATGLTCSGTTCTGLYPPHTTVILAAAPAMNATFTGWSGAGCTGTGSCTVILDLPTTVTAGFDWKFVPSHVSETTYDTSAANLSGVTAIDTHNLTINGAAPPSGVTFTFQSGVAVMSVGTWNVTSNVTVTGDAPLVVVAAGAVVFSSGVKIHADATGSAPGPGGNAACSAAGAGVPHNGETGSGGGGNFGGGASSGQIPAGSTYGGKITDLCGGAAGGTGTRANNLDTTCANSGNGGGGGGFVQISSAVSIMIPAGLISVNGGGGDGSCHHNQPAPSLGSSTAQPGGGGSGGEIFLEAPTLSIGGGLNTGLFADGGGGGGSDGTGTSATAGSDGNTLLSSAPGGTGSQGNGGAGAFSADSMTVTPATAPTMTDPYSGAGGGGVGRIWLRTRGTPASISGANLSPPATIDTSL